MKVQASVKRICRNCKLSRERAWSVLFALKHVINKDKVNRRCLKEYGTYCRY